MFFFFSSRRRHTRFDCDWSSDVCSSDLEWAFGRPLDVALLSRAAELLLGEHDFRGLAATGGGSGRPHYRSRVALAPWAPRTDGAGGTFTIEADRVLHRLGRFLVGAMGDVALGRRPLDDLPRLLS